MKKWLKRIFFGFVAAVLLGLAAFGYAYYIEPYRLTVEHTSLRIPNWNKKLDGFKVVAISDIHGGSKGVSKERLRELVKNANEQKPDLILLLGDFVSQKRGRDSGLKMSVETIAKNLTGFRAKYGVFAVIGNHDWWYNEDKISVELEKIGVDVLENEVREISLEGEKISLWGIEDFWKRREVLVRDTFDKIEPKENIIAITHNPDSLLKTPKGISIMFAGHSHGGQVKFPIYGGYPFVNDKRFMEGEAVVDGKHVFVTTGVGCSVMQIRFRVPPEIAVIKLYAKR